MTMRYALTDSPLGPILVAGDESGLRRINFQRGTAPQPVEPDWILDAAAMGRAIEQLGAYFAGQLRQFDLRLAPRGTPFQQRVWQALRGIPYGQTATYGQIAARLGKPGGARAVGGANGRNPLPIVVPCHRVVAAQGKLGGFTGGLDLKRGLLALEERHSR